MKIGDIFANKHGESLFMSSYHRNYIVADNLDPNGPLAVRARAEVYNDLYTIVTTVLSGKLMLRLNGMEVEINANEYIVIMPCIKVEVKESRCRFISFMTKSYIVSDIYTHVGIPYTALHNCFCFHHHAFSQENINAIYSCYLKMKREHLRADYSMKESTLRALVTLYVVKLYNFLDPDSEFEHYKHTKQRILFKTFLDELSNSYTRERSVQFYADKLGITSKYLSTISAAYTGEPASVAIDKFVIFRIQQMLYSGEKNIKQISMMLHFPTQSFFGRYYKRITGLSPRDYIKKYTKKARR